QVFGFGAGGPSLLASFFAPGFDLPSDSGLQAKSGGMTGVGSVAFGATDGQTDRQEILVSSAQGSRLHVWRYTFAPGATVPTQGFDLYNQLTKNFIEADVAYHGIPILDPVTGAVLDDNQLFEGGGVAGTAAR
ncbi:MAG TPA: hypothetical protein VKE74_06000, partial [Gemmataceae bacterium]|nr:hypothetical protein [Gemmataceae bacterium]